MLNYQGFRSSTRLRLFALHFVHRTKGSRSPTGAPQSTQTPFCLRLQCPRPDAAPARRKRHRPMPDRDRCRAATQGSSRVLPKTRVHVVALLNNARRAPCLRLFHFADRQTTHWNRKRVLSHAPARTRVRAEVGVELSCVAAHFFIFCAPSFFGRFATMGELATFTLHRFAPRFLW